MQLNGLNRHSAIVPVLRFNNPFHVKVDPFEREKTERQNVYIRWTLRRKAKLQYI